MESSKINYFSVCFQLNLEAINLFQALDPILLGRVCSNACTSLEELGQACSTIASGLLFKPGNGLEIVPTLFRKVLVAKQGLVRLITKFRRSVQSSL